MNRVAAAITVAAAPVLADVDVFTVSWIVVSQADEAMVHVLDGDSIQAERLGADLPADPVRAAAVMKSRLDSADGANALEAMRRAAEGRALAGRLGIRKLPAIVFDRREVVYGVRDVAEAREIRRRWLRSERAQRSRSGPGRVPGDSSSGRPPPSSGEGPGVPARFAGR